MATVFSKGIKPLFLAFLFTFSLVVTGWAHTMPVSEIDLNGISPAATLGSIKQVYGEPLTKESLVNGNVRSIRYQYGPLLEITGSTTLDSGLGEDELLVSGFRCKANNFYTPRGFKVDQPISKVISLFGAGEKFTSRDTNGQETSSYLYIFPNDRADILIFYTDMAGFITEIAYRNNLSGNGR